MLARKARRALRGLPRIYGWSPFSGGLRTAVVKNSRILRFTAVYVSSHAACTPREIAHTALSFNAKQVLAPLLCYLYVIAFGIGNGTFVVAVACGAGIAQNCDAGSLESCSHIVNILPAAHRD